MSKMFLNYNALTAKQNITNAVYKYKSNRIQYKHDVMHAMHTLKHVDEQISNS